MAQGDPVDPKSRHKGKYETESYLAEAGLPYTAIRPTYIYGPQVHPLEMDLASSSKRSKEGRGILPKEARREEGREGIGCESYQCIIISTRESPSPHSRVGQLCWFCIPYTGPYKSAQWIFYLCIYLVLQTASVARASQRGADRRVSDMLLRCV